MEKESTSGSNQPIHNLLGIGIEGETRSKLQTITTWSKITAMGGFVNMGLNLITTFTSFGSSYKSIGTTWLIVTSLLSLVISFFLYFFLWQFSKSLKTSLDNENQEAFTAACMQLKAYMRMLGILLIASIIIGIVSVVFLSNLGRD